MGYVFDNSQHLHVGFYENGLDIESISYKVLNQDAWIMYIEWDHVKERLSKNLEYQIDPLNGLEIMCILEEDLDYATADLLFEKWLTALKISD